MSAAQTDAPRRQFGKRRRPSTVVIGTEAAPRRLHALCTERQAAAKLREGLIAHVGGLPNAVQLALIDAVAELKLKIGVADRRYIDSGYMSDHARREYLALVNSYGRLLRQLGMKGAPERAPSLAEIMARPASGPTLLASAPHTPPAARSRQGPEAAE